MSFESRAQELDKGMKEVKVKDKDKKGAVNGMETISSEGTGVDKISDQTMLWRIAALKAPKTPVLVAVLGAAESLEKHSHDLEAMFERIKKR